MLSKISKYVRQNYGSSVESNSKIHEDLFETSLYWFCSSDRFPDKIKKNNITRYIRFLKLINEKLFAFKTKIDRKNAIEINGKKNLSSTAVGIINNKVINNPYIGRWSRLKRIG